MVFPSGLDRAGIFLLRPISLVLLYYMDLDFDEVELKFETYHNIHFIQYTRRYIKRYTVVSQLMRLFSKKNSQLMRLSTYTTIFVLDYSYFCWSSKYYTCILSIFKVAKCVGPRIPPLAESNPGLCPGISSLIKL